MFKSKLSKVIVSLLRRIAGVTRSGAKRLMRAMLQALMAMGRRARLPVAGFVLPTVTMVLLVVILLTVAITLRSFDRANMARNVRVNQQVLAAATPAIDRAKAKIQYALSPQGSGTLDTPSDLSIYQAMDSDRFKFGDEDVLQIKFDLDNLNKINPAPDVTKINESERINTAWRFPVDTDNNGKFDTYTLYGIYFRSPPRDLNTGEFNRSRKGLEARTPPMLVSQGSTNAICKAAAGTSASLVGSSDWYKAEGVLKKSLFVYTVNVPITNIAGVAPAADYEIFKGTQSFSALEYQQDQKRIPLQNNAVVYEDDLEVSPGPALRLNGRIFTNSNFMVTTTFNGPVAFYLVSSKESCFYNLENSKIVVSGNVVNGWSGSDGNTGKDIAVHLFGTQATDPVTTKAINGGNQSVAYKDGALGVMYNNKAYSDRIGLLVSEQEKNATSDPQEVKNAIATQVQEESDPTAPSADRQNEIRTEKLESYFRLRTRKVPFAEVPAAGDALAGFVNPATKVVTTSPFGGTGEELRPVDAWVMPLDTNTKLDTSSVRLAANSPDKVEEDNKESELGDRIVVGNNLPALRWRSDLNPAKFVGEGEEGRDTLTGVNWLDGGQRYREPQVKQFADVGGAERDGFWEKSAAQAPQTAVDGIGGLRVITGAGVYERTNSFLPPPKVLNPVGGAVSEFYDDPATTAVEKFPVVWPDSMPMSPGPNSKVYNNNPAGTIGWADLTAATWDTLPTNGTPPGGAASTIDPNTSQYAKGDLRMRASAIYHYADNTSDQNAKLADTPLACVSSYYDPSYRYRKTISGVDTLFDSSLNRPGLPSGSNANGKSNNGIVYGAPEARPGATLTTALLTDPSSLTPAGTTENRLNYQASLVFPEGRFVNENLRKALQKVDAERSLSEKAAIDSTLCSFKILADPTTGFDNTYLDDGTIREVAFLNPREVKAIDKDNPATAVDETYSLSSPLASSTGTNLMAPAQRAQLTGQYDNPLAERQPLEIRVTQLDIDKLRKKTIPYQRSPIISTINPEYMLPYSGLIYASRDDAAPDRSDRTPNSAGDAIDATRSKLSSSTDSRLDPSRRPHGIMLINGSSLGRPTTVTTVTDVLKEKGLLLTSNLPVYIQGEFNKHTKREFTGAFSWTPSDFYGRPGNTLDPDFACRLGDPRYPGKCAGSDNWRAATVLSDAITLLSEPESGNLQNGFRYGFRNHGDFDLRNNAGTTIVGYDLNGNGSMADIGGDETIFGFDLNGNGNNTETDVKDTDVTAKAARRINGFGANNYVTNGLSSGGAASSPAFFDIINQEKFGSSAGTSLSPSPTDANYSTNNGAAPNSSYFNNFVTPVQRRANFPEYVMEICRKLPVSACGPNDWVVGVDAGTLGTFETTEIEKASLIPAPTSIDLLLSGTTARPAIDQADRRYPRRVAFVRDSLGKLVLDRNNLPIARGIASPTQVDFYATSTNPVSVDGTPITPVTGQPQLADNALWYATTTTPTTPNDPTKIDYGNDKPLFYAKLPTANVEQPQLRPTLQIQATNSTPAGGGAPGIAALANDMRWIQKALTTEFNLIVASNDVPSRAISATLGDTNGGMQNLPRFMENWKGLTNSIAGSFIQFKRSAYATAPYLSLFNDSGSSFNAKLFETDTTNVTYKIETGGGTIGYFVPPNRDWGFDVGLLSQPPDLFAQKFTLPASQKKPDEYFREISRDDDWVKALLCAEKLNNRTFSGTYAANDSATKPRTDCPDLS